MNMQEKKSLRKGISQVSVVLMLLMLCGAYGFAQSKKLYTIDDLIPGGKTYAKHSPKTLQRTVISSKQLIYYKDKAWYCRDLYKPNKQLLFMDQLAWKAIGGEANMPYYFVESSDGSYLLAYCPKGLLYHISTDGKAILGKYDLALDGISDSPAQSTADGAIAVSANHNIYLIKNGQRPMAITHDGNREIVYGEVPHRREFGLEKGMFWSPSGRYLAFYRMDQSMVTDYPLVETQERVATLKDIKYPMAGMKSHEVTVGIYDTKSDTTIYLKTGTPKDRYFTNLAWGPDEHLLYIDEVNRGQDTCHLVAYDIYNGEPQGVILTETNPKYIEPLHPIVFMPDGKTFLRLSRNDGYNHLYLYNTKGRLVKQISSGPWEIIDFYGIDDKGKYAYFAYNDGKPVNHYLGRVSLKGGAKVQKITQSNGTNNIQMNAECSAFLDRFTSITEPCLTSLYVRRGNRWKETELMRAENPDTAYDMPKVRLGSLKDASGEYDLAYKITYPDSIPEGAKLPTIVYVYGGPHAQLVHNTWSLHRGWDVYMAQKGYVVFTIDGRGSANRGLSFENCTFRDLGTKEMQDQIVGVKYLKSLPFVDANRIGVHGWSFGGYMTTNMMLTYPEIFKVGVAGGPVMDWSLYEVMYGERYMDTPQENPEGYKHTNLLERAGDLKGRLLIIHGDQDPTVVWQNSLRFLKSCINHRTYPDYMVYPGHEHNVIGKDRPHLYYTISRYFDDFLKPIKVNNHE